jgi:protoporphyrinogen oxidase
MDYDYVIVGGGIAGLYSALKITQAFPKAKVALTEMYSQLGGRIETYRGKNVQFEAGAGRIHNSHRLVAELVKRYGLTKIKIPNESDALWIGEGDQPRQNSWPSIANFLVLYLSKIDPLVLQTKTVKELLEQTMEGFSVIPILRRFAYTSELYTLRADLALHALKAEFSGKGYFYTLKEGIDSIPGRLHKEVREKVDIFLEHRLTAISGDGVQAKLHFKGKKTLTGKKVILAIPSEALKGLAAFKNLPILKRLTMRPLLRIYGVFPTPPWFEMIPRTITDSPLRHIIPISSKAGSIMTSYTDAKDTEFWMALYRKYGEKALSKRILEESEKLFKIKIPEPHLFKLFYWKDGCSYWLPGLYDVKEASEKIMNPLPLSHPNIFVCGESYSTNQAWIESALEHTDAMLERYIFTR